MSELGLRVQEQERWIVGDTRDTVDGPMAVLGGVRFLMSEVPL